MRKLLPLLALVPLLAFGQTSNVQKTTAGNRITGDLRVGSGRTLEIESGGGIQIDAGAITTGILTDPMTTAGDILYRNSSNLTARKPLGSAGQILGVVSGTLDYFTPAYGDASTNTSTSVDSEVALFSSTTGKIIKRASGSGVGFFTSGVLSYLSSSGTGNVVRADSPAFTTQITAPKIVYTGSVTETTGTGSPESVVAAAVGSVYHRTDGGTGTTLYIKESGSGNTGWTAVASGGGSGDVVGPSSATDARIALFDSTTGKLIKQSTALTESGGTITSNTFLSLAAGGSNQNITLSPSGTGGVGIGTTPTNLLHIKDSVNSGLLVEAGASNKFAVLRLKTDARTWQFATGGSTTSENGAFYFYDELAGAHRLYINTAGEVLLGTTTDSGNYRLQVNGNTYSSGSVTIADTTASTSSITGSLIVGGGIGLSGDINIAGKITTASSTPSSASDTGVTGTIAWDASYIYICTATNTWKRVAIATW